MKNLPLPFAKTVPTIRVSELERYAEGWTLCCEINQHSTATLAKRKIIVSKLLWFLHYKEWQEWGLN